MARPGGSFEISTAPMIRWTDHHFRSLVRILSRRTFLYTEMLTASNILRAKNGGEKGVVRRLLAFDPVQHPIAVQLGGCCPNEMSAAALLCEKYGYDEININCGCPANKVADKGKFGAALMLDHGEQAKKIVLQMRKRGVSVPITVKCRLGADDVDQYQDLLKFVETVSSSGVQHFIIHARKCILSGIFSAAENRRIPPLRWDWVLRLAKEQRLQHLKFSINGGVSSCDDVEKLRVCAGSSLSGVMIGRAVYKDPWMVSDFDRRIFGEENPGFSRQEVVDIYLRRCETALSKKYVVFTPGKIVKPLVEIFKGANDCHQMRCFVDRNIRDARNMEHLRQIVSEGLSLLDPKILDERPPLLSTDRCSWLRMRKPRNAILDEFTRAGCRFNKFQPRTSSGDELCRWCFCAAWQGKNKCSRKHGDKLLAIDAPDALAIFDCPAAAIAFLEGRKPSREIQVKSTPVLAKRKRNETTGDVGKATDFSHS